MCVFLLSGPHIVRVHLVMPVAGGIRHFYVHNLGFSDHSYLLYWYLYHFRDLLFDFNWLHNLLHNHLFLWYLYSALYHHFSWHLHRNHLFLLHLHVSLYWHLPSHPNSHFFHNLNFTRFLNSDCLSVLFRLQNLYRYHGSNLIRAHYGNVVFLIHNLVLRLTGLGILAAGTGVVLHYTGATGLARGYLGLVDGAPGFAP